MFRWLKLLRARKPDAPSPLECARAARRSAAEAYAQAVLRGDTRSQHVAWNRLNFAKHHELAVEVESRG
jgi:hypothetical protein